jgi:hypothetical protein
MIGKRTQAPDDIDQLQHQIDNTREELADTVGPWHQGRHQGPRG